MRCAQPGQVCDGSLQSLQYAHRPLESDVYLLAASLRGLVEVGVPVPGRYGPRIHRLGVARRPTSPGVAQLQHSAVLRR